MGDTLVWLSVQPRSRCGPFGGEKSPRTEVPPNHRAIQSLVRTYAPSVRPGKGLTRLIADNMWR